MTRPIVTTLDRVVTFSISLRLSKLADLDQRRGLISRSKYIARLIEEDDKKK